MKTIVIANQKGGVGKTTTSAMLAMGLARAGHRVLAVDADAQGNLGMYLGAEEDGHATLSALLEAELNGTDLSPAPLPNAHGVDVLMADRSLFALERRLEEESTALRSALSRYEGAYDYAVIDTGPHLGPMLTAVLLAADRVIIPVEPELFAASGLDALLQTIAGIRRVNRNLSVAGLLIARVDSRSAEHQRIGSALRKQYSGSVHVYEQPVPLSEKVREAARKAKSPFEYSPRSYATRAYNKLVQEVLADEIKRGG